MTRTEKRRVGEVLDLGPPIWHRRKEGDGHTLPSIGEGGRAAASVSGRERGKWDTCTMRGSRRRLSFVYGGRGENEGPH